MTRQRTARALDTAFTRLDRLSDGWHAVAMFTGFVLTWLALISGGVVCCKAVTAVAKAVLR